MRYEPQKCLFLSHNFVEHVKVIFKWTKIKQDVFNEIKRIVACDNLLAYPHFNEVFKVHTNASDFQLEAVIIHKVKPIYLYSRKLTDYQKR